MRKKRKLPILICAFLKSKQIQGGAAKCIAASSYSASLVDLLPACICVLELAEAATIALSGAVTFGVELNPFFASALALVQARNCSVRGLDGQCPFRARL